MAGSCIPVEMTAVCGSWGGCIWGVLYFPSVPEFMQDQVRCCMSRCPGAVFNSGVECLDVLLIEDRDAEVLHWCMCE